MDFFVASGGWINKVRRRLKLTLWLQELFGCRNTQIVLSICFYINQCFVNKGLYLHSWLLSHCEDMFTSPNYILICFESVTQGWMLASKWGSMKPGAYYNLQAFADLIGYRKITILQKGQGLGLQDSLSFHSLHMWYLIGKERKLHSWGWNIALYFWAEMCEMYWLWRGWRCLWQGA